MEKENVEKIMEEYKSKLAEINNETEIKRQQLHIDRLKEEQESIEDKQLYLEYSKQIEKAQEDLENLKSEKEASKKDFEEYVKNNRQEIIQKLISKQKELENEIEEYEIKFQSQMHILRNFKYEYDKNNRVTNGNEYKEILKISESISKHKNQLKEEKNKCEQYIVELRTPTKEEEDKIKTINSILNGTYGEEETTKQTKKSEPVQPKDNETIEPKRATKSEDNPKIDPQSNQSEQQEPTRPENNKPTEPELTEQEKRKMVEEYLALEEKNLKAHKKLRDCLQYACEFKLQDNNKAGKMSLENARNYEKNIEKYENQLLEMAEKVDPYLNQEDIDKLVEYGNNKNAIFREIREIKEQILNIGAQEQSNPKIPEPKDPEPTKPNNNEKQKDVNNLHFYANLKETKFVIKYTLDKNEKYDDVNYQASAKWGTIIENLKNLYPEINFESEDGKQELKKYEDADPNLVKVLSNNKNRLEEYIALLNGEKKIDVNDKNALKITYDIRKLSKCELSREEKEAIEDYAFKHRDIAEVKKNALQSIKFKFREMKEKRENKKAVKALKSGKIVTSPVKDGISSEAKDTITKMVDDKNKREKNINSMDQFILSDEEKQKLKEEKDKRIKEEKQRQDEERIKWQIENISKKIENATSNEEKVAYQKLLKEKLDEQAKLNKTKIDNTKKSEKDNNDIKSEKSKSEEQIESEKPKADEQKDELKKPTSNWRDSMKVEPKIETTAQEQETPTETPINNEKDEKKETGNSTKPNEPKKLDDLAELITKKAIVEQKLNDLPKDDENRKGLEIVLKTFDEQISKIKNQQKLSKTIGELKAMLEEMIEDKKKLEVEIASTPEGNNKESYKETIKIMDKNIKELENTISKLSKQSEKDSSSDREAR